MANIKSAKKRIEVTAIRTAKNKAVKSKVKTAIKKVETAVANNDKEAVKKDLSINAGKEIIDNLKKNDQLGWEFVSEEKAIKGVKSGKYYAAIVIPDDFSSSLVSVLSGKIEIPELKYYINEKPNAVAPKITDAGATTIQTQINSTFSSVASESVSKILKTAVRDISGTVTSVNSEITDMLDKTQQNIAEYVKLLWIPSVPMQTAVNL